MPSLWEGVYDKMNTVKYRALAKDGTWRYGEYPHFAPEMSNTHYPMDVFWNNFLATFRRETLGQWTGLLDKQGKEIYEGDIVKTDRKHPSAMMLGWREYSSGVIDWVCEGFKVCDKGIGATRLSTFAMCGCCPCGLEVIGNIYENPELLDSK